MPSLIAGEAGAHDPDGTGHTAQNGTAHGFTHITHDKHADGAGVVNMLLLMLLTGLLFKLVVVPRCRHRVPYTVCLLFVGTLYGSLHVWSRMRYDTFGNFLEYDVTCDPTQNPTGTCASWFDTGGIAVIYEIAPHTLLFIFLPALIFESAFYTNTHIFVNNFVGILVMAMLGVVISISITASFVYLVPIIYTPQDDAITYASWGYGPAAIMVGSILSATDPVAVVALLKELGASEELGVLIEGESLLNDGTAYVAFLIAQAVTSSGFAENGLPTNSRHSPTIPNASVAGAPCHVNVSDTDQQSDFTASTEAYCARFTAADSVTLFVLLVGGGVVCGYIVGRIGAFSLDR